MISQTMRQARRLPMAAVLLALTFLSALPCSRARAQAAETPANGAETPRAQATEPPAKELLVLPFTPDAEVLSKALEQKKTNKITFGLELSDVLVNNLIKMGYTDVLARAQLQAELQERNLVDTGIVKERDALEIGKKYRARYLLAASITGFRIYQPGFAITRGEVEISARIVDCVTGKYLPTSLVAYGSKDNAAFSFASLSDFLQKTLLTGDKWLSGSLLGEAARLATANLARKFLLFNDGGVDVLQIDSKQQQLIIQTSRAQRAKVGKVYMIYRIEQVKDKAGNITFEKAVKVMRGRLADIGRASSRLSILELEGADPCPKLEKQCDGKTPFFALPANSPRVKELEQEAKEAKEAAESKDAPEGDSDKKTDGETKKDSETKKDA